MDDSKRLLLISNSTLFGRGYLDHAETEIKDILSNTSHVLFVPYALHDRDAYAAQAGSRFHSMGYSLSSIHECDDGRAAVENAEAIFVGGGNTFRLLLQLYQNNLVELIRQRAEEGMIYIGSSAGANLAAPTIKTTNDMPIVQPPSFDALGLVPFQINPHYLDPDPHSTHKGETRQERIIQFLEENQTPVIGLREGTMLRIQSGKVVLKGTTRARLFRRGLAPVEVEPGTVVNNLFQPSGSG